MKKRILLIVIFSVSLTVPYWSYRKFVNSYEQLAIETSGELISFMQNRFREPESIDEFCEFIQNHQNDVGDISNWCKKLNRDKVHFLVNDSTVAIEVVFGRRDNVSKTSYSTNYTFFDYLKRRDIKLVSLSHPSISTVHDVMLILGYKDGYSERIFRTNCITSLGCILEKYKYKNDKIDYSCLLPVFFNFEKVTEKKDSLKIVLTKPQNLNCEFQHDIEEMVNKYFYHKNYDKFRFAFSLDSTELKKVLE